MQSWSLLHLGAVSTLADTGRYRYCILVQAARRGLVLREANGLPRRDGPRSRWDRVSQGFGETVNVR